VLAFFVVIIKQPFSKALLRSGPAAAISKILEAEREGTGAKEGHYS
jgi:hypothetical protein